MIGQIGFGFIEEIEREDIQLIKALQGVGSADVVDAQNRTGAMDPGIQEKTIQLLLNKAFEHLSSHRNGIVVQPSFLGKSGHPVFFSNHLYSAFDQLNGDEGEKKVISYAESHDTLYVEDPGILFDVDTLADYQSLLKIDKSQVGFGEVATAMRGGWGDVASIDVINSK